MSEIQSKVNLFVEELVKSFSLKVSKHFDLSYEDVYNVVQDKVQDKTEKKTENKTIEKKSPVRSEVNKDSEKKSPVRSEVVAKGSSDGVVAKGSSENKESDDLTREKIISPSTTKDMLAAYCKKRGLKMSGKKEELVQRLLDCLSSNVSSSSSSSTSNSSSSSSSSKSSSSKKEEPSILKNIKESSGKVEVNRNKFGNYEHSQSGLVFNTNKLVYARQLPSGELADLVVEDIELCKKYKLPYKLPENLNTSKNLDDVKIDEIEEEEELEEEDLEEEELDEDDDVQDEEI